MPLFSLTLVLETVVIKNVTYALVGILSWLVYHPTCQAAGSIPVRHIQESTMGTAQWLSVDL